MYFLLWLDFGLIETLDTVWQLFFRSPGTSEQRQGQQSQQGDNSHLANVREAVQRQAKRLQLKREHLPGDVMAYCNIAPHTLFFLFLV